MSTENQVIEFDHVELKGKLVRVIVDRDVEKKEFANIKKVVKEAIDNAMKKGGGAILPDGVHIELYSLI